MLIDILIPYQKVFSAQTLYDEGVGGAEYTLVNQIELLAENGYQVRIFQTRSDILEENGVTYLPHSKFQPSESRDVFILYREPASLPLDSINAGCKVFWSVDQYTVGDWNKDIFPFVDQVIAISQYHKEYLATNYRVAPHKIVVVPCLIRFDDYDQEMKKIPNKILYCSMPNRGLEILLRVFPFLLQMHPELELYITGSFKLWGLDYDGFQGMEKIANSDNVHFLGKLPRKELVKHQLSSNMLAYPSIFPENFCLAAVECQYCRTIPVTLNCGALSETVLSGAILDGEPRSVQTLQRYAHAFLQVYENQPLQKIIRRDIREKIVRNFGKMEVLKKMEAVWNNKPSTKKGKIALFRGPSLNYWETQNLRPLAENYEIDCYYTKTVGNGVYTLPFSFYPSSPESDNPGGINEIEKIPLNEYDAVYTADTTWRFTTQLSILKSQGALTAPLIGLQWENIPFAYEDIDGVAETKAFNRKWMERLLTISERTEAALELEGLPAEKMCRLHMGIDTDLFYPISEQEKVMLRIYKGLSPKSFVGLTVCRFVWEKGVFEILNALRLLLNKYPELEDRLQWIFIGSGPEETEMKEQIRQCRLEKNVLIVNGINYLNIHQYFQISDLFVLMSQPVRHWQEQFGMVFAESMACGVPVITARSGSIEELFGKACILVNPGDSLGLFKQIDTLIQKPEKRQKLKEKGIALISKKYTPGKYVQSFLQMMKEFDKSEFHLEQINRFFVEEKFDELECYISSVIASNRKNYPPSFYRHLMSLWGSATAFTRKYDRFFDHLIKCQKCIPVTEIEFQNALILGARTRIPVQLLIILLKKCSCCISKCLNLYETIIESLYQEGGFEAIAASAKISDRISERSLFYILISRYIANNNALDKKQLNRLQLEGPEYYHLFHAYIAENNKSGQLAYECYFKAFVLKQKRTYLLSMMRLAEYSTPTHLIQQIDRYSQANPYDFELLKCAVLVSLRFGFEEEAARYRSHLQSMGIA